MNGNWRKWNILGLTLFLSISCAGEMLEEVNLLPVTNLKLESEQAANTCTPLLLMFADNYCEYCELLEEEIIHPMLRNRDYEARVLMRKLHMNSAKPLTDISGKKTNPSAIAARYNVFVTPTVLLIDSQGRELAERLVGINTVEMYGGYLDSAIDTASDVLRKTRLCD